MNKLILAVAAFFCSSASQAQLTKGHFLAGGSLAFSSQKYSDGDNTVNVLTLAPNAGYFFMNKGAAGLKVSFTNYSNGDDSFRDFMAGPFARYYFLPVEKKTNILLEAHFMAGTEKYEGFDSEGKTQWGFAAGPAFFLNEFIAVETTLSWQSLKYETDSGRYNKWGITIGFQLHLKGKKKEPEK
jgi:hypothetical protein